MRPRLVILDFDGVVVDSMGAQAKVWTLVGERNRLPSETVDQLLHNLYEGKAGDRMFEGLGLSNSQQRRLRSEKDSEWSRIREQVSLMPGAHSGIRRLAAASRLLIATTADRNYVMHILAREGLLNIFHHIQTDSNGPYKKPMPEFLLALIANHGDAGVKDTVMVGDTETDRLMSIQAGVRFFGFRKPGSPPVTWRHEEDWERLVPQILAESTA